MFTVHSPQKRLSGCNRHETRIRSIAAQYHCWIACDLSSMDAIRSRGLCWVRLPNNVRNGCCRGREDLQPLHWRKFARWRPFEACPCWPATGRAMTFCALGCQGLQQFQCPCAGVCALMGMLQAAAWLQGESLGTINGSPSPVTECHRLHSSTELRDEQESLDQTLTPERTRSAHIL